MNPGFASGRWSGSDKTGQQRRTKVALPPTDLPKFSRSVPANNLDPFTGSQQTPAQTKTLALWEKKLMRDLQGSGICKQQMLCLEGMIDIGLNFTVAHPLAVIQVYRLCKEQHRSMQQPWPQKIKMKITRSPLLGPPAIQSCSFCKKQLGIAFATRSPA